MSTSREHTGHRNHGARLKKPLKMISMISELDLAFIPHYTYTNGHQTRLFRYNGTHLSQSENKAY